MATEGSRTEAAGSDHLVVLQHGIMGTAAEMQNIGNALLACDATLRIRVVLSAVNEWCTYDGVDAGGRRLAELVKQQPVPQWLSLIGHSLGGLYCRSAAKLLHAEGWFERNGVRPGLFLTTATPHLGMTEVGSFWQWGCWAFGTLANTTVLDLGLQTESLKGLSDEVAVEALRIFRRRVAFANLEDDLWVRPCSGLLWPEHRHEQALADGVPQLLPDETADMTLAREAPFSTFSAETRDTVAEMFEKLNVLPWERYLVRFDHMLFTGSAHSKICNHSLEDTGNCGALVVEAIAGIFASFPSKPGPGASDGSP